MATSTLVSAFVRSLTLVTVGTYLIIRLNFIFCGANNNILLFIGVITILLARFTAIFEMDIEKVIRLSESTQLGTIIIIIGTVEQVLSFLSSNFYINKNYFISLYEGFFYSEKDSLQLSKMRIILNFSPAVLILTIALGLSIQVL